MIVFSRSPSISCRGVLGAGRSNLPAGGGYSMNDDERMLNGVEKGTNPCWGHCGVCSTDGGAAVIIFRSLSSFASCLAKEHSSLSKMVRVRQSSAVTSFYCSGSIAARKLMQSGSINYDYNNNIAELKPAYISLTCSNLVVKSCFNQITLTLQSLDRTFKNDELPLSCCQRC